MARTKPIRRSYGAGEWGRNRVRVFPDPKTGLFQIEWRDNGRRLTRSLKHRDWRRAKRQADEFAAGYLGPELHRKAEAEPEPLTLETLFDIYGEEVTPTKTKPSQRYDRATMGTFLGCFGRNRDPATLSQRDWDRFIRERRAGRVGASGSPVSDRTIEYDLKFLIAVFNWVWAFAFPAARHHHVDLTQAREQAPEVRAVPVVLPAADPLETTRSDHRFQLLLQHHLERHTNRALKQRLQILP